MTVLTRVLEDDGILHLGLNVPGKKNALTDELRARLRDVLAQAQCDGAVRSILISGARGDFCSGGDIAAMTGDPEVAHRRMSILHDVVRYLLVGAKPAVAAVSGSAFGAGFSLALCCDQVVADTTARFCASFGRVGLPPDLALSFTLPRRVGEASARRLLLSSSIVGAEDAERLGVIDTLVTPDALLDTARERARELSAYAQETKGHVKSLVTAAGGDIDALLEREMRAYIALLNAPEHRAARAEFLARPRPGPAKA